MSDIVTTDLVKTHGSYRALDSISFSVARGELVVLLGPSGCGKSTILRLIAGLDLPDTGTIRIGGNDVTYAEPAARMVSMVFQSYGLFPHLTVAENILFGLQVRRVPKSEREERLKRASALLGLDTLLARRPSQLSGGQQQRVALARAVVSERPICLMDEPLSNLDAQLRTTVRREIGELQKRLGLTMIYVTHDQIEAMTLADRIVLLRSGHVMQEGTPQDLYDRPANRFVASFIGSPPMNLLDITTKSDIEALKDLWPSIISPLERHGGVTLGVRPDDLFIRECDGTKVKVLATEYVGGGSMLTCELLGQRIIVSDSTKRPLPAVGQVVGIGAKGNAEHLFHPQHGDRLA